MKIEKIGNISIPLAIQVSQAIKAATSQNISESRITVITHNEKGIISSVEVLIDEQEVPYLFRSAIEEIAKKILK